ncbi:MAG: hypothetical protein AAB951_01835 [Patescibacteria group bacterium]
MKEEKKSGELEPTISDVFDAVQAGFVRVETVLDRHEELLAQHGKILKTLVAGQDNLTERVNIIDQRLSKTQSRIEDVVDENQDSIFDHERRISVLEKAVA